MNVYIALIVALISFSTIVFASEKESLLASIVPRYDGSFGLAWSMPTELYLESWRVEFTLSGEYISRGDVFMTYNHPTLSKRKNGITLAVTDTLQFQVKQGDNAITFNDVKLVSGKSYTMVFQFVLFENVSGEEEKGEFTLSVDNQDNSFVIEDVASLEFTRLHKSDESSMLSMFQTYMGAYNYSDMRLYQLSSRVIPEPSTSILFTCSLVGMCLRRRRY